VSAVLETKAPSRTRSKMLACLEKRALGGLKKQEMGPICRHNLQDIHLKFHPIMNNNSWLEDIGRRSPPFVYATNTT